MSKAGSQPWRNVLWKATLPAALAIIQLALGAAGGHRLNLAAVESPGVAALANHGAFLQKHCFDCHDDIDTEAGLNLLEASFDLSDDTQFALWTHVYDRIDHGEMPPKKRRQPQQAEVDAFLAELSEALNAAGSKRVATSGRSDIRRLNRHEYENTLRDLLAAPWLMVAEELPADGTFDLFAKSSRSLDISHVQMMKFLEVGERALRTAVDAAAFPTETHRYYARDDWASSYVRRGGPRSNIPIIGWEVDPNPIINKKYNGDPDRRDEEAIATFYGAHPSFTRADFLKMNPPIDGQYRLRWKNYTVAVGNNGFFGNGLDPEETGDPNRQRARKYRPNKLDIRRSQRIEPITIYGLVDSGDTRWLHTFDAIPEPHVYEHVVTLQKGENLRPDPTRLVSLRPGWSGNPHMVDDEIPGWAIQWLEVEGPIHEQWPPASYQAVFGDLPFTVVDDHVRVQSDDELADCRHLLYRFAQRAWRGQSPTDAMIDRCVDIYHQARELGHDFTDAMIVAFNAVLMTPQFLYLEEPVGTLSGQTLASRLSFFLWNTAPDEALLAESDQLTEPSVLKAQAMRLLEHDRSKDFVDHFLDYWLDLLSLYNTVPDSDLYPDYFLDDQLTESALRETRLFFTCLIQDNLPARNLIDSDFTFLNRRLADHYQVPFRGESSSMVRTALPEDSPRGGLLTQASILKVSANGTTTSPVLRGLWVVERMLGIHIGNPPSGIEAIEPDTRGAVTIREQLSLHTEVASCATCHAKFDPYGFAMESFDVFGGWRDHYRALGEVGEPVSGFGMNGHAFQFRHAQPVESHSVLASGHSFNDIRDLKQLLLLDERTVAKNLVNRLVAYATGAPVAFHDRKHVETILDQNADAGYPVRDLILGVITSPLFNVK